MLLLSILLLSKLLFRNPEVSILVWKSFIFVSRSSINGFKGFEQQRSLLFSQLDMTRCSLLHATSFAESYENGRSEFVLAKRVLYADRNGESLLVAVRSDGRSSFSAKCKRKRDNVCARNTNASLTYLYVQNRIWLRAVVLNINHFLFSSINQSNYAYSAPTKRGHSKGTYYRRQHRS